MINKPDTAFRRNSSRFSVALRTVFTYLVLSILWILISDLVVIHLPAAQELKDNLQTFKGLIFVILSALLLYVVVRSFTHEHEMLLAVLTKNKEQLTALTQHLQSSIEEERSRISREIHDDLGQTMTALRMDIAMALKSVEAIRDESEKETLRNEFTGMISMIDVAIQSIRKIIRDLRPEVLDTLGLYNSIRWQTDDFVRRSGIRCTVTLPERRMEFLPDVSTALFRILQESLTNVLKYAEATEVHVDLSVSAGSIVLSVTDNGKGIGHEDFGKINAFGLLGMRERVKGLGGSMSIMAGEGSGAVLKVVIPNAMGESAA